MPTKARILTYNQIKKAIDELDNSKDDVIYKVIVLLMYFGLLRGTEVLNVKREELSILETGEIQVEYQSSSKTRVKGFSYLIPKVYQKEFKDYLDDWSAVGGNSLLKNYNVKCSKRKKKTGWRTMQKMCNRVEQVLGLSVNSLTTHAFRRSGATALANAGASLIQLKRAGRWQSSKVAEGYIENCLPEKRKQVSMMTCRDAIDISSVSFLLKFRILLTKTQTPQNRPQPTPKTWQDSLTTKSNLFPDVEIKSKKTPEEEVGRIVFQNCTFNISAGGKSNNMDIDRVIRDIVTGVKNNVHSYQNCNKSVSRAGILKNSYSQQSQTIQHIDFGSVSDSKNASPAHTLPVRQVQRTPVVNPYKRTKK